MKKRFTKMAALLLASAMLFTACGGNAGNKGDSTGSLTGTYDITVWVSETAGVKELTQQQIAKFCEANPGLVINATIEGVTEAD